MEIKHTVGADSKVQCMNNKKIAKNAKNNKNRPKPKPRWIWITQERLRSVGLIQIYLNPRYNGSQHAEHGNKHQAHRNKRSQPYTSEILDLKARSEGKPNQKRTGPVQVPIKAQEHWSNSFPLILSL
jgi:hypothetical protein